MRRGATLLEVLIAVAIVAVLVALILPAIQVARAESVRLKSKNKLRQIVLATHNYSSANGGVLLGFTRTGTDEKLDGPGLFEPILPFLESENMPSRNPHHPTFSDYVPAYVSPADPSFSLPYSGPGAVQGSFIDTWGEHSYPANWQALRLGAALDTSFSDGTSTTIAFAERYSLCGDTGTMWWLIDCGCRWYHDDRMTVRIESNPTSRRPTFADPNYEDVLPITSNGVTRPSVAGRTFQIAPAPRWLRLSRAADAAHGRNADRVHGRERAHDPAGHRAGGVLGCGHPGRR